MALPRLQAAEDVTGHKYETIGAWLGRAGRHADALTTVLVHDLHLTAIELDAFWSLVRKRGEGTASPRVCKSRCRVPELVQFTHFAGHGPVFIIDGKGTIRLILTYPASTGRNFEDLLRIIDSLQLTDAHKVATPINWKMGADVVILPAVSSEDADRLFPQGYRAVKSYLRLTQVK